ncbi:hypothetical protein JTB14_028896 [Gonioctena quinquepunctata]|nr:hypothetical protein JTB14_028896 [Gonioctena quinquepunctata]
MNQTYLNLIPVSRDLLNNVYLVKCGPKRLTQLQVELATGLEAKIFGLLSAQLALAHVLSKFEFKRSARTPDPVKFSPGSIMVQSDAGIPMEVKIWDTNLPEDS